jgi:hypothetical protein
MPIVHSHRWWIISLSHLQDGAVQLQGARGDKKDKLISLSQQGLERMTSDAA